MYLLHVTRIAFCIYISFCPGPLRLPSLEPLFPVGFRRYPIFHLRFAPKIVETTIEKVVTVVKIKTSRRLGGSPDERRTIRHAPHPNNFTNGCSQLQGGLPYGGHR
jgi:hypothetical protein